MIFNMGERINQGGGSNILHGADVPLPSVGEDGEIYLQHFDFSQAGGGAVSFLRTNNVMIGVTLSNWVYRKSDKVVLKYKNAGSHGYNWGRFLISPSDYSILTINYNLYNGRRVINIRHGGAYSSDYAYVFDSPSNLNKYYELTIDGSNIAMRSGSQRDLYPDTEFSTVLGASDDTDTESLILLDPSTDGSTLNVDFHQLLVYRNNVLIHNYFPIMNGVKDFVDSTVFAVDNPNVTYGGPLTNSVFGTFCKVNGAWQNLIGTDISDVNTNE